MSKPWATITELWRYPVSSLGGEILPAARLDARGVSGDRIWGLVDAADGSVASPDSERRWRIVAGIRTRLAPSGLEMNAVGDDWLRVPSPQADAAASRVAGFPVRFSPLAPTMAAIEEGQVAPRYDRGHLHILTTASLAALEALVEPQSKVDVRRFRPNIVVDTGPDARGFVEQDLIGRTIAIGNARVLVSEPCSRCSFTAIAQRELPFAKEILHAIAKHGGGGFGVLATVLEPAEIWPGDPLVLA